MVAPTVPCSVMLVLPTAATCKSRIIAVVAAGITTRAGDGTIIVAGRSGAGTAFTDLSGGGRAGGGGRRGTSFGGEIEADAGGGSGLGGCSPL